MRFNKSGIIEKTTSNRIVLHGIHQALLYLEENQFFDRDIRITTCNMYAVNVVLKRWKANKNLDLLKPIWDLIDEMQTVDLIKEVKPAKLT